MGDGVTDIAGIEIPSIETGHDRWPFRISIIPEIPLTTSPARETLSP
jgi:hypothetical protein